MNGVANDYDDPSFFSRLKLITHFLYHTTTTAPTPSLNTNVNRSPDEGRINSASRAGKRLRPRVMKDTRCEKAERERVALID